VDDQVPNDVPSDALTRRRTRGRTRRRRSWYRRRLRLQRTGVAVLVGTVIAAVCWQNAARYLGLPTLHTAQILPDSFSHRVNMHKNLSLMAARSARPKKVARMAEVYPYSVVPGGVNNPADLRAAAARDAVVRQHYSNFDYKHAQLVRVNEAREVYLSYRIRNSIFWTRKKALLRVGEFLLTDGKITARAHCGNQISDTAKPEVSDEEPAEDVLDQPVVAMESPYLPFRAMLPASDLPIGQPTPPALFAGGFIFPTVPYGAPIAASCPAGDRLPDGRCNLKHHPPVVPEPSTMLLLASGLALIAWRYRWCHTPAA
jgi:hypothetical protein